MHFFTLLHSTEQEPFCKKTLSGVLRKHLCTNIEYYLIEIKVFICTSFVVAARIAAYTLKMAVNNALASWRIHIVEYNLVLETVSIQNNCAHCQNIHKCSVPRKKNLFNQVYSTCCKKEELLNNVEMPSRLKKIYRRKKTK